MIFWLSACHHKGGGRNEYALAAFGDDDGRTVSAIAHAQDVRPQQEAIATEEAGDAPMKDIVVSASRSVLRPMPCR